MNRDQLHKEEQDVDERDREDEEQQLRRPEGAEERGEASVYTAVVCTMNEILSETPTFDPPDFLGADVIAALEQLYAAKTAVRESVGDGHVWGLERMASLNLSLANLRPVLSVGMAPGKDEATREEIGEQVLELRNEIKQVIYKEAVPVQKREKKEEEDDAGDEEDPDEDEAGE